MTKMPIEQPRRKISAPMWAKSTARWGQDLLRVIKRKTKSRKYEWSPEHADVEAIRQSGLFDPDWYLATYPDVAAGRIDPVIHYLSHGALEGRDPGPKFSTSGYATTYPDVAAHGVNPLLHYIRFGRAEGRELKWKDYPTWVKEYDQLSDQDRRIFREEIAQLRISPLISILMPVYNSDCAYLERAVNSVFNQSYQNWELCISDDASTDPAVRNVLQDFVKRDSRVKVAFRRTNGHISANSNSALALATGEFVALLDHDDELAEQALFWFVQEIQNHPDVDILYCDEDKIDEQGGRFAPFFKPDWNPAMVLAQNYVCHMSVYRRSLVERTGGFRIGFEGSQDFDLLLRCADMTEPDKIRHIPRILYHWRTLPGSTASQEGIEAKPYAWDAGARAIQDHLDRRGIQATVKRVVGQYYQVEYATSAKLPKVSIIIPTACRLDLVRPCMTSVLKGTTYPDFEVVVTVNESHVQTPEQKEFVDSIKADSRVRVIMYENQPFNYSSINNSAVKQTNSPLICFLNDDVAVITKGWLEKLVARVMLDGVGAVGPLLYYPHDAIQHAGVILGIGGVAGHQFNHLQRGDAGYFGRALLEQDLSCVTAACMLMRREVFESVGGFDEELAVAFNDVDLCIRVRQKGWRIIWTPVVEMYHHESASLGKHDSPQRQAQFAIEVNTMRSRWGELLDADPFFNPNLSLGTAYYTLAFPPRISKLPVPSDTKSDPSKTLPDFR